MIATGGIIAIYIAILTFFMIYFVVFMVFGGAKKRGYWIAFNYYVLDLLENEADYAFPTAGGKK